MRRPTNKPIAITDRVPDANDGLESIICATAIVPRSAGRVIVYEFMHPRIDPDDRVFLPNSLDLIRLSSDGVSKHLNLPTAKVE